MPFFAKGNVDYHNLSPYQKNRNIIKNNIGPSFESQRSGLLAFMKRSNQNCLQSFQIHLQNTLKIPQWHNFLDKNTQKKVGGQLSKEDDIYNYQYFKQNPEQFKQLIQQLLILSYLLSSIEAIFSYSFSQFNYFFHQKLAINTYDILQFMSEHHCRMICGVMREWLSNWMVLLALLLTLYNNCSKIAMQHRKISEEEASRLFEATFLLISKQNLAEKQRRLKGEPSPPHESPDLPSKSPKKDIIPAPTAKTPPLITLPIQPNTQNCAQWAFLQTETRWPFQKSFSSSEESPGRATAQRRRQGREQSSDDFEFHRRPPRKLPELLVQPIFPITQKPQPEPQDTFQELYVENMMKDLKRDLEIKYRGKLCKSQEVNHRTGQVLGYNFLCKSNSQCSFKCFLQFSGKRNVDNEKLYKLIVVCGEHQKQCVEGDEEVAFMRLTKTIDAMERPIINLLTENGDLKPKEILITMAKHIGEDPKFIYNGLSSKDYLKAAKKYFDNLIAKLKNQLAPPPLPTPTATTPVPAPVPSPAVAP